jgi:hypothetical protein
LFGYGLMQLIVTSEFTDGSLLGLMLFGPPWLATGYVTLFGPRAIGDPDFPE